MMIISIFDLDGVLVESREFEASVHNILVHELSIRRACDLEVARGIWASQLNHSVGESRWADYAFHCEALDLGEVYREAHYASSFLLMMTPDAQECVEAAASDGPLWLATDASRWAWQFKLEALGVPLDLFEEKFDLDRCRVPKRDKRYWTDVEDLRRKRGGAARYFDDREECLSTAASVLSQTQTSLVTNGDLKSIFETFRLPDL
jgi:FMN phosphatase YigB (HAD superfamily)